MYAMLVVSLILAIWHLNYVFHNIYDQSNWSLSNHESSVHCPFGDGFPTLLSTNACKFEYVASIPNLYCKIVTTWFLLQDSHHVSLLFNCLKLKHDLWLNLGEDCSKTLSWEGQNVCKSQQVKQLNSELAWMMIYDCTLTPSFVRLDNHCSHSFGSIRMNVYKKNVFLLNSTMFVILLLHHLP